MGCILTFLSGELLLSGKCLYAEVCLFVFYLGIVCTLQVTLGPCGFI